MPTTIPVGTTILTAKWLVPKSIIKQWQVSKTSVGLVVGEIGWMLDVRKKYEKQIVTSN